MIDYPLLTIFWDDRKLTLLIIFWPKPENTRSLVFNYNRQSDKLKAKTNVFFPFESFQKCWTRNNFLFYFYYTFVLFRADFISNLKAPLI